MYLTAKNNFSICCLFGICCGSQIAAAVKQFPSAPYRLALTGSPIENSLDDLHSILEFVQSDLAGSLSDFRERFPQTEEMAPARDV